MQSIATLIYYCASRMCHNISNADGESPPRVWTFDVPYTFNELDEEALPASL